MVHKDVEDLANCIERQTSCIENFQLLDLNDDCLTCIYEKLDLMDKARLALTCQRLHNMYAMYTAPAYRKFSLKDSLITTDEESLEYFFQATAPFMQEVFMNKVEIRGKTHKNILLPLFRYGCNVKLVEMNDFLRYGDEPLFELFDLMQSVENLSMISCGLYDTIVRELQKLPNLRVLRLTSNPWLAGAYLAHHHKLEELYLDEVNLDNEHFLDIAQCLTNLRILDVRHYTVTLEASHALAKNCKKLETIRLSCRGDAGISVLAKLPSLRKMSVVRDASLALLAALAEHKAEQLEFLELETSSYNLREKVEHVAKLRNLKTFYWRGSVNFTDEHLRMLLTLDKLEKFVIEQMHKVTNDGVLAMLKNCVNLNYMAVSACKKISQTFVFNAIDILKERKLKFEALNGATYKPFVLAVYGTSIGFPLLEHPRILAASSILELRMLLKDS